MNSLNTKPEDYRDQFLKFKLKHFFAALVYTALAVASIAILLFSAYLIVCFMDRTPPLVDMHYRADDAKIGGNTKVTLSFYRTRVCEYSFIRMVTDSKGKIVYQQQGSRPVNGPIRQIDITEEYPIAPNAAPGTAILHLYASWKCPGNVIHLFNPIQKEYTDTLELSLNEGQSDLSELSLEDAEAYIEKEKEEAVARQDVENRLQLEQEAGTASVKRKKD